MHQTTLMCIKSLHFFLSFFEVFGGVFGTLYPYFGFLMASPLGFKAFLVEPDKLQISIVLDNIYMWMFKDMNIELKVLFPSAHMCLLYIIPMSVNILYFKQNGHNIFSLFCTVLP